MHSRYCNEGESRPCDCGLDDAVALGRRQAFVEVAESVRGMKTQAMDTLRSARVAKRWDRAEEAQANANALQWVLDEIEARERAGRV